NVTVTALTKPALGTATSPQMDVGVQAISSGAGTLTITFSDNNFGGSGPATGVLNGSATGTKVTGDVRLTSKCTEIPAIPWEQRRSSRPAPDRKRGSRSTPSRYRVRWL